MKRKSGETHKQFIQRLEAYNQVLEDNNRALRVALEGNQVVNPRTGNAFSKEAQEMYFTVALINAYLKEDTDNSRQMAAMMARGQLHSLGFNEVEIDSGEVLKDEAYTGEK